MLKINKYEVGKFHTTIEILTSDPFSGKEAVSVNEFATEQEAQHYYWNIVWSYLNFGVERVVYHSTSIAMNYFNPRVVPFYNDENWRNNYWELIRQFNMDYFGSNIIATIEAKAHHIVEHQEILLKAIPIYMDAGKQAMTEMVNDLITLSNTIIKNKKSIQDLTPQDVVTQ